jgi:flagellar basal body-associated protein FliL
MNEQNLSKLSDELVIRTICMIFIIIASVMYLIMYHKAEDEIIDKEFGTNYQNKDPNTDDYPKYIALIFLVVNSIFLYMSFTALKEARERQEKTGKPASLEPYYLLILINGLQLTATIISLYNVFVNDFGRVGLTR